MTNTIAFYIGIVIVLAFGLDLLANDGAASFFLVRKFADLVEWVEFWR